ncbi:MAG: hypothetical protein ACXACP_12970 [Candidatus Hodarchaeales archaeon]|jgi:hypothetical protein
MSRERRSVSQRKIRKISRKPDKQTIRIEKDIGGFSFQKLSPKTRLYYTKVISGALNGLITGTLFVFFPSIDPGMWFMFLLIGLGISVSFARQGLKITPEEVDGKRLWLSGTFTYTLLFIVVTSLIWMLPGPRF